MSLLFDFEDRIGNAVEGLFAGVFRAPVQPAELARAAAKEMDRRKKLGVGKVYAPTMYSILLSPHDGDALGGFADTLAGELETYLAGYARERDYTLAARPRVRFLVDEELKLGRYEIIGELLSPEEIAAETPVDDLAVPASTSSSVGRSAAARPRETAVPVDATSVFAPAESPRIATVSVPGIAHDVALGGERVAIGRLKTSTIHLADVNASREHAALVRDGDGWALEDLGSTNGTLLNGARVSRARLSDGDVITVGVTELVYHEPKG